jgi:hypothetical protein
VSTKAVVPTLLPEQIFNWPLVDQAGMLTRVWLKFFQTIPFGSKTQQLVRGTHASRKNIFASSYVDGSVFSESDTGLLYMSISGKWTWFAGIQQGTLASLPTDLTTSDSGLLYFVTDYAHVLQWNGAGWQWAPGELGSDFIVAFVSGPNPAAGWQVCDGSVNVAKLNPDGTLTAVTVPNTPGSYYRQ